MHKTLDLTPASPKYLPICSAVLMNRWEKIDSCIASSSVPTTLEDSFPTCMQWQEVKLSFLGKQLLQSGWSISLLHNIKAASVLHANTPLLTLTCMDWNGGRHYTGHGCGYIMSSHILLSTYMYMYIMSIHYHLYDIPWFQYPHTL